MIPLAAPQSSWLQAPWQNGQDGRTGQHVRPALPKRSKIKALRPWENIPSENWSWTSELWLILAQGVFQRLKTDIQRKLSQVQTECGRQRANVGKWWQPPQGIFLKSYWVSWPQHKLETQKMETTTQTENESTGKQINVTQVTFICVWNRKTALWFSPRSPLSALWLTAKAACLQHTREPPKHQHHPHTTLVRVQGERWVGNYLPKMSNKKNILHHKKLWSQIVLVWNSRILLKTPFWWKSHRW